LGLPDESERLEILQIHTKKMKMADDVNLKLIAADTHNCVGSDLAAICRMAATHQVRKKMHLIDLDEDTIDAVVLESLLVTMENMRFAVCFIAEQKSQV
jgi:transitional endoplasmic reticulum ATPase